MKSLDSLKVGDRVAVMGAYEIRTVSKIKDGYAYVPASEYDRSPARYSLKTSQRVPQVPNPHRISLDPADIDSIEFSNSAFKLKQLNWYKIPLETIRSILKLLPDISS